jgi:hypothetical protein
MIVLEPVKRQAIGCRVLLTRLKLRPWLIALMLLLLCFVLITMRRLVIGGFLVPLEYKVQAISPETQINNYESISSHDTYSNNFEDRML